MSTPQLLHVEGLPQLISRLDAAGKKQMAFAIAKAMTVTVKGAAAVEAAHINTVFDRPTPFTQKSVAYTPAKKNELRASVFIKDIQAKYLQAEAEGGNRGFKDFEEKFADTGRPLIALPGRGVELNQYGNISKAKIRRIARDVNTLVTAKRFFKGVPKGSDMPAGVYARVNNNMKITPLITFATQATYKKRFDFSELARSTITANFQANLIAAWEDALRSAMT